MDSALVTFSFIKIGMKTIGLFFFSLFICFSKAQPSYLTLESNIPIKLYHIIKEQDSTFWIVLYRQQYQDTIEIKPFLTKSEALYFANEDSERFISIRHVEKPMQMKLNMTKTQKICEEEIKEWVFS